MKMYFVHEFGKDIVRENSEPAQPIEVIYTNFIFYSVFQNIRIYFFC